MSNFEKLVRENITLRVLLIALLMLGIGMPIWYLHTLPWMREPYALLVKALAETILIAGFVGILYELIQKRRFEEEMKLAVIQAINADSGLLKRKMFTSEMVDSIIKNCLQAKLCNDEIASIFFDGLIFPYIDIDKFRTTFKYEIQIDPLYNDCMSEGVTFSKDAYFRTIEELTFTKRLHISKDMELAVALCLNDRQLEYYNDKLCIYRTIFRVRESEKPILETKLLPENIFKIAVEINGQKLTPIITEYDVNRGIKIHCKYEGAVIDAGAETEFKIKVVTLHDKNVNYYTAYLYDPSFNPEIKLRYNDEMVDIFAVTHFTNSKVRDALTELDKDAKYISVKGEKGAWVFPTSGVVFIWKACK